jgi:predicted glycoside hydrolase/deacetylase ChbG (UPF0249 family)
MSKEVFFIADDFGMSAAVNEAMLYAHQKGVLHGGGLMMGQPGTEEAVRLARDNPAFQTGFHLHLCDSQPLTADRWPWASHVAAGWSIGLLPASRAFMRREVQAQWQAFRETGIRCAYVNSHHHLHVHPMIYAALLEAIGSENVGWLRLGRPCFFDATPGKQWLSRGIFLLQKPRRRRSRLPVSDTLWGVDRIFRMRADEVKRVMESLPDGRHEFMFHPRTVRNDADTEALIELKEQYGVEC